MRGRRPMEPKSRDDRRTIVDVQREVRRSATAEVSPQLNLEVEQFLDHADERFQPNEVLVHTSILLPAGSPCATIALTDRCAARTL